MCASHDWLSRYLLYPEELGRGCRPLSQIEYLKLGGQIKLLPRVMFDLTEVGVPEIVVYECCARQLRASRRWVQTIARLTNA